MTNFIVMPKANQTIEQKLDRFRTYKISEQLVAKVSKNLFVFRRFNEQSLKDYEDIATEAEIGKKANEYKLQVPKYHGIQLISVAEPLTGIIVTAPALIMDYVPGTPADQLTDEQSKREYKAYKEAVKRVRDYFHAEDSNKPRNRIWNAEINLTTLIDLELWELK